MLLVLQCFKCKYKSFKRFKFQIVRVGGSYYFNYIERNSSFDNFLLFLKVLRSTNEIFAFIWISTFYLQTMPCGILLINLKVIVIGFQAPERS